MVSRGYTLVLVFGVVVNNDNLDSYLVQGVARSRGLTRVSDSQRAAMW